MEAIPGVYILPFWVVVVAAVVVGYRAPKTEIAASYPQWLQRTYGKRSMNRQVVLSE